MKRKQTKTVKGRDASMTIRITTFKYTVDAQFVLFGPVEQVQKPDAVRGAASSLDDVLSRYYGTVSNG